MATVLYSRNFMLFCFAIYSAILNSPFEAKIASNLNAESNRLSHPSSPANLKNELFLSEFEILDMLGHDGRLQSGYCCNGARIGTSGVCKGGNTTCAPYWRICIVEMTPDMIGPVFASREAEPAPALLLQAKKPTNMLMSLVNKIFSFYGSRSGGADRQSNKKLREILDTISPKTCTIGFWTSDVIQPDTQFPLRMSKPVAWSRPPLSGKGGGHLKLDRNVMAIVEIWSRNKRLDAKNRLIARQIQHYNVQIEEDQKASDWFFGGKTLENLAPPQQPTASGSPLSDAIAIETSIGSGNRRDKLDPHRRNRRIPGSASGGANKYNRPSYGPSSMINPFNTWMYQSAVLKAPSGSGSFKTTTRLPISRTRASGTSPVPLPLQPSSVFKYKFRWHVKALKRRLAPGPVPVSPGRGIPPSPLIRDETLNCEKTGVTETNCLTAGSEPHPTAEYSIYEDEDSQETFNQTWEGCPQGYQGADCTTPICLEGCHPDHGYCELPGECACKLGWTGMLCATCMTLPGCNHGSCSKPMECNCEPGWSGFLCHSPKCKEGCDPFNGDCTLPGECKCRSGWKGANCTECQTGPGCEHGTCQTANECICEEGWSGLLCNRPICAPGCTNGWCERPHECRCDVGWTGHNCSTCVPYPGCQKGTCTTKPWTCECTQGWGGFHCDEPLNWCQLHNATAPSLHASPCQNGGTCQSVEASQGNYTCLCPRGYTGKNCELF